MDHRPDLSPETYDLLVAYALDALDPAELADVQRLLAERPELHATVAELRATTATLPYGLPSTAPRAELRQRVLDHAVGRTPNTSARQTRMATQIRVWLFGLGGLAAALLVALISAFGQISGLQNELAVVREQRDQAQVVAATAQAAAAQLVAVVAQPAALGTLAGTGGQATVLQNADGTLILAADLPPLAANQVYQLWLIEGNNAPVSGGVFTVDATGYGLLTLNVGRTLSGATLAITAEPAPGSPGPTTDILVLGELT